MHPAIGLTAALALSAPLAGGGGDPCADLLSRLAGAAGARGYAVSVAGSELTGHQAHTQLQVTCEPGHRSITVAISQPDGGAGYLEFSGAAPGDLPASALAFSATHVLQFLWLGLPHIGQLSDCEGDG